MRILLSFSVMLLLNTWFLNSINHTFNLDKRLTQLKVIDLKVFDLTACVNVLKFIDWLPH